MPYVPNGTYKIISVKFSDAHGVDKKDEQVADLINGGPGPIAGRPDADVHNDKWVIWNKYDLPDSNSVTIKSVESSAPDTYAYGIPVLGNPIVGSNTSDTIVWALIQRVGPGGIKVYNIQYPDKPNNDLIWELKEKNENIKYGNYYDGTQPYNEWLFVPVAPN